MPDARYSSTSSTRICFSTDLRYVVDALLGGPTVSRQTQCNKSPGAKNGEQTSEKTRLDLLSAHDQVEKVLKRKSSL
jgi:hypothetical protein